ncbi:MAG: 50S ribosomal protein L10 [Patescibacteria group bacterium]
MKKAEKVTFVENLVRELQGAKSVVLVNYAGLGVKAQQNLKARLKEIGGRMLIVKNTLLKLAGKSAKIDKEVLADSVLSGQTALVLADSDPIAPLQVLGKFAKESETPKFKVGIIDGKFFDALSLSRLSNLPGRDALLSQLLGSLMSSMYGLVGTLQSPLQKLVYIIDQKSKGGEN